MHNLKHLRICLNSQILSEFLGDPMSHTKKNNNENRSIYYSFNDEIIEKK